MQEQIYLSNTYCFYKKSNILDVVQYRGESWIALEKNIFHPKGGGQPSDIGFIDGIKVIEVKKNKEGIVFLKLQDGYKPLGSVEAEIDKENRKKLATLHTAGHLINAVMKCQGFSYYSCNHEPRKSRVVMQLCSYVDKCIIGDMIEENVNNIVKKGFPVTATYSEEGLRVITIGHEIIDHCAGTHVKKTSMIEEFKIRSIKVKKETLSVGYDCSHTLH